MTERTYPIKNRRRLYSPAVYLFLGLLSMALTACGGGGDGPPGGTDPVPTATIISPESGRRFLSGETVRLSGSGQDSADGALSGASLVWTSNLDGQIGTGTSLTMTAPTEGTHLITLRVTDSDGLSSSTSITITIGNAGPDVTITTPAEGQQFPDGATVSLEGTANDPEEGSLTGDALVWTSDKAGTIGSGESATAANLKGTHQITLTATDSDGATNSRSVTIQVGASSVTATISLPADRAIYDPGDTVVFRGIGVSNEEGNLTGESLVWVSDRDGQIGTGTSFSIGTLTNGAHDITLVATDSQGNTDSDQITIFMGSTAPRVSITQPVNATRFELGERIIFEGDATDVEDGDIPQTSLTWTSNRDGEIGRGGSVTTSELSEGTHQVTLTAIDSLGTTGQASVTVYVGQAGPGFNTPPTAEIAQPAEDAQFQVGEFVVFLGRASDTQDGILSGESLSWSSNLDGELGTGETLSVNTLSVGNHTITLRAVDAEGSEGLDTVKIVVGNSPPVARILSPEDGATFLIGEFITFEGTATDLEDGTLTGRSLIWSSNLDGQLGTENTLTINTLRTGAHTITLKATDSDRAENTATISIIVANSPPVVSIIRPAENSVHQIGEFITFDVEATDSEDGTLSGEAIAWTSNLDGELGTGESLTINTLSIGTHTVTVKATDNGGADGTASVVINVGNSPPTVQIERPLADDAFMTGDFITFDANANDLEDGPLTGASVVWTSNLQGQIGTGESFLTATLNPGRHEIAVTATDSLGATASATTSITLTADELPAVTISAPTNQASFKIGETINFVGGAVDAEDGELTGASLKWTATRQGQTTDIGEGGSLAINTFEKGSYVISLTATDTRGNTGVATVTVIVGNSPPNNVSIVTPINGETYAITETILFSAIAEDEEDGLLTGNSLVWTSNLEGQIGTGASFTLPSLTFTREGQHQITLTASDKDGLTTSTSITISVQAKPTVTIDQPTDRQVFDPDTQIIFQGTATDLNGDPIAANSIIWTSITPSGDTVQLGIGQSITYRFAELDEIGQHIITLAATDAQGNSNEDSIILFVGNSPPEVTLKIQQPQDGDAFSLGETIIFDAEVRDPEDGTLPGDQLVWVSNINGSFSQFKRLGEVVTDIPANWPLLLSTPGALPARVKGLAEGTHTITLTATDSKGLSTSASDTITVNISKPTRVEIIKPDPAVTHIFNESVQFIVFSGEADDFNGESLSDAQLLWTSDIDGLLGTGGTIITGELDGSVNLPPELESFVIGRRLSAGRHSITLTAFNKGGGSLVSDPVTVIIGNTPPVVQITAPNNNVTISSPITFTGVGNDVEDGDLPDGSLLWFNETGGVRLLLGTGKTLANQPLPVGDYTIVLLGIDSENTTGTATINLTVE